MAVQRAKINEIPEGAVRLTESQVRQYHMKLIREWTPMTDVWPFVAGDAILSTAAAITGTYMNIYFRKKLFLGQLATMSTFLPISIIPAITSATLHQQFITSQVLSLKTPCPVCIELRASAIQVALGTVFPLILAPLACFSVAVRKYTYDVPSLAREPKEVFKLLRKLIVPKANVFFSFALANAGLGAVITHFKAKSLYNIQMKVMEPSKDEELVT